MKPTEIKITNDPTFFDEMNGITPAIRIQLERCFELALKGKKSGLEKIQKQIKNYPHQPAFKNYLSIWYSYAGHREKSFDVNEWLVEQHPDYLFGKLNLAIQHFKNEQYERIPEILGDAMEITALYPERDIFHISEVAGFVKVSVKYYAAIGNMDKAEAEFKYLSEIARDEDTTEEVENYLMLKRLEHATVRMQEEERKKIKVKTNPQQKGSSNTEPPTFTHPEILQLYNSGLYISKETIDEILALPKKTLIQDLHLVLQDSIDRLPYFQSQINDTGWDEQTMNFAVHAIYLLGELESRESLAKILNILRQSEEYMDVYFGDFLTAALWEPVYKISRNDLDKLDKFLLEPGIYTYSKSLIADVIEQIAFHDPARKQEVINSYKKAFAFFSKCDTTANIIDSDLIALMICSAVELNAKELLPEIKALFDKEYVSTGICGNYQSIENDIKKPYPFNSAKKLLNITDRYQEITSTWAGYQPEDYNIGTKKNFLTPDTPIINQIKTGRNEPCPCGSGKKYKKCCM